MLPHEETLSKAKADRFELMKATGCNFSDVYALYMDDGGEMETLDTLELIMREPPLVEVTDEAGLTHRLWAVADSSLTEAIAQRFTDTKLYIADGHHRYETALRYRDTLRAEGVPEGTDADYIMMMLVEMDHPGLVVLPTHRMIRGIAGFDPQALVERCRADFDVQEGIAVESLDEMLEHAYQAGKKAFGFYTGGETFTLLTLQDESVMDAVLPDLSEASRRLDVNVLHSLILERMLGIDKQNMANGVNLTYTRSLREALDDVGAGAYQAAFLLNPTRVEEIRDVAAAGEKMPQKSTYFYPKLITGLTMNSLR